MQNASRAAVAGVALTVVGAAAMRRSSRILRATGIGIVPFELAGRSDLANRILGVWGPEGQRAAGANVRGDFAFIAGYTTLAVLPAWTGARSLADWHPAGGVISRLVAGGAIVAGACDVAENLCLLEILRRARDQELPIDPQPAARRAARFARVKFALIGLAAVWDVARFGWWLRDRVAR
jgi:hypothetical protein